MNLHEARVKKTVRELTACDHGLLNGKRYLIMDRDAKLCESFRSILRQSDVESVVPPQESPSLNARPERYFGSLKSECVSRVIFCDKRSLERAVREYAEHYHGDRNHQGLGNLLINPAEQFGELDGKVECSERLGSLLSYYHRVAV